MYLLGHSEGALFATLMAQQHKPAGIIPVSPAGYTIDIILKTNEYPAISPEALAYINDAIDRPESRETTGECPAVSQYSVRPGITALFYGVDAV